MGIKASNTAEVWVLLFLKGWKLQPDIISKYELSKFSDKYGIGFESKKNI